MPSTRVVIIGAGQAGLAVSYLLTAASIDHQIPNAAAPPSVGAVSGGIPCGCSPRTG